MTSEPNEQLPLPVLESTTSDTTPINGRCLLRREGRVWMVSVAGLPMHQWTRGDAAAEAYARVSLVRCGYADQNEVAKAFGCSTRTLRRQERLYERLGIEGLGRRRGRPVGTRGPANAWVQAAKGLQKQGLAVRTIAERLRVSVGSVSKWLSRTDPASQRVATIEEQGEGSVPKDSDPVVTGDFVGDPMDRGFDRVLARMGMLHDADPVFASGQRIAQAVFRTFRDSFTKRARQSRRAAC